MFLWSELAVAIMSPSFVTLHLLVSEIAKYITWGCFCCFTRTTYIVYYNVYIVVCSLKSMCIPSFVLIGCCVSELHGHLCPYHNVWPEVFLLLFYKNHIVYRYVTFLFHGRYGYLSVRKVSFLNSVRLLRYASQNWRRRTTTTTTTIWKWTCSPILVIFWGPPYFYHRYPFVKTDSRLSAYCHGNADIPGAKLVNHHAPLCSDIICTSTWKIYGSHHNPYIVAEVPQHKI